METGIEFTKKQKEYLLFNLRWLNNARVDEWLNYLPQPIGQFANSENQENYSQQPLKTNSNVGSKSYGVEKNELGSMETGDITSSGVEDHLPKSDFSPADTKFANQKESEIENE